MKCKQLQILPNFIAATLPLAGRRIRGFYYHPWPALASLLTLTSFPFWGTNWIHHSCSQNRNKNKVHSIFLKKLEVYPIWCFKTLSELTSQRIPLFLEPMKLKYIWLYGYYQLKNILYYNLTSKAGNISNLITSHDMEI